MFSVMYLYRQTEKMLENPDSLMQYPEVRLIMEGGTVDLGVSHAQHNVA